VSSYEKDKTLLRDAIIEQAILAGKFPPTRRDHYRALYDADPEGTRGLIARLASALPAADIAGTLGEPAYPPEWLASQRVQSGRVTFAND
jgi:hypothetical protein